MSVQEGRDEDHPSVTIVTINRNNAQGLGRTINSILPVIGAHVSYLVVDGASTDESVRIAKTLLEGVRGCRLISEPDSGIYSAMNKGWSQASGRYVAYINSGDELIPEAFQRFVNLARSSEVDVIYAKTLLASTAGNIVGTHERHPWHLKRDTLPHPATLVRRVAMSKVGGFNENYSIVADRDLFVRLHQSGANFVFFPEPVSVFYLGGVSSSWRAGLEFSMVSYRHGYIGFSGWIARYFLYRCLRFNPSIIDEWFPLNSRLRGIVSRLVRLVF